MFGVLHDDPTLVLQAFGRAVDDVPDQRGIREERGGVGIPSLRVHHPVRLEHHCAARLEPLLERIVRIFSPLADKTTACSHHRMIFVVVRKLGVSRFGLGDKDFVIHARRSGEFLLRFAVWQGFSSARQIVVSDCMRVPTSERWFAFAP